MDIDAVRDLYDRLLERWNDQDATGYSELFTPDGNVVGFDGGQMDGAAEIKAQLSEIFIDHTVGHYVSIVREVRELGPGTVLLRAVAGMVPPGGTELNPDTNAVQSLVAVGEADGPWRIALFHNTPAAFHGRPEAARRLTEELRNRLVRN